MSIDIIIPFISLAEYSYKILYYLNHGYNNIMSDDDDYRDAAVIGKYYTRNWIYRTVRLIRQGDGDNVQYANGRDDVGPDNKRHTVRVTGRYATRTNGFMVQYEMATPGGYFTNAQLQVKLRTGPRGPNRLYGPYETTLENFHLAFEGPYDNYNDARPRSPPPTSFNNPVDLRTPTKQSTPQQEVQELETISEDESLRRQLESAQKNRKGKIGGYIDLYTPPSNNNNNVKKRARVSSGSGSSGSGSSGSGSSSSGSSEGGVDPNHSSQRQIRRRLEVEPPQTRVAGAGYPGEDIYYTYKTSHNTRRKPGWRERGGPRPRQLGVRTYAYRDECLDMEIPVKVGDLVYDDNTFYRMRVKEIRPMTRTEVPVVVIYQDGMDAGETEPYVRVVRATELTKIVPAGYNVRLDGGRVRAIGEHRPLRVPRIGDVYYWINARPYRNAMVIGFREGGQILLDHTMASGQYLGDGFSNMIYHTWSIEDFGPNGKWILWKVGRLGKSPVLGKYRTYEESNTNIGEYYKWGVRTKTNGQLELVNIEGFWIRAKVGDRVRYIASGLVALEPSQETAPQILTIDKIEFSLTDEEFHYRMRENGTWYDDVKNRLAVILMYQTRGHLDKNRNDPPTDDKNIPKNLRSYNTRGLKELQKLSLKF